MGKKCQMSDSSTVALGENYLRVRHMELRITISGRFTLSPAFLGHTHEHAHKNVSVL